MINQAQELEKQSGIVHCQGCGGLSVSHSFCLPLDCLAPVGSSIGATSTLQDGLYPII